jgi:excisionase family DNA binding protein
LPYDTEIRAASSAAAVNARLPAEPAKPKPEKPKRNLTPKQAAERLNCCKLTIHRLIKKGKLRAFHLSKRSVRIPVSEIERLEAHGVAFDGAAKPTAQRATESREKLADIEIPISVTARMA